MSLDEWTIEQFDAGTMLASKRISPERVIELYGADEAAAREAAAGWEQAEERRLAERDAEAAREAAAEAAAAREQEVAQAQREQSAAVGRAELAQNMAEAEASAQRLAAERAEEEQRRREAIEGFPPLEGASRKTKLPAGWLLEPRGSASVTARRWDSERGGYVELVGASETDAAARAALFDQTQAERAREHEREVAASTAAARREQQLRADQIAAEQRRVEAAREAEAAAEQQRRVSERSLFA